MAKANHPQQATLTLRQRLPYWALRLLLGLSARLSLNSARRIGRLMGRLYYRVGKRRVKIARINIAIAYPELTDVEQEALARQCIEQAGMWFMEAGAVWRWPREKILRHVTVANPELLERALANHKGVILAAPHMGNWEVIAPLVSEHHSFACFYKHDPQQPLVTGYIEQLRSRHGTIMASADAKGVRVLYKHLRNGHVAGILPDHIPTMEMGVFAPFYGRPALTGTLISSLARKNNAVVLTAAAIRTPDGFRVHYGSVADQHSDDPLLAATAINRAIEATIALAPSQFQWVYPRYKKRQDPSQPSPYRTELK